MNKVTRECNVFNFYVEVDRCVKRGHSAIARCKALMRPLMELGSEKMFQRMRGVLPWASLTNSVT